MKYCGLYLGAGSGNQLSTWEASLPRVGRKATADHGSMTEVKYTNTFYLMVWTISQQPGKSDFSRPLQGPFRSVAFESFPFLPRISFPTGWSSRFNFSLEPQIIKSKLPSQLKNHFHQSLYLVWTGQLNLVVCSFVPQMLFGQLERSIRSFSGMVLVKPKCHPCAPSSAFRGLSMQQLLLVQQLQMLTQKMWWEEFVLQGYKPVDPKGIWAFQML